MALPASPIGSTADPGDSNSHKRLGDFTVDTRLLIITPMAAVVGLIGALVAVALVWLIGSITNLAYYHRGSSHLVSPAENQLGLAAVLVPMVGGLLIGLMAQYGSEKIRGHGIPEAMEAILIGGASSRLRLRPPSPLHCGCPYWDKVQSSRSRRTVHSHGPSCCWP